ncbi:MAG: TOPRIM nucleotidyl transferase/hydrolase domain-containing protein [Candidatus Bathyarchaeia archaeon]
MLSLANESDKQPYNGKTGMRITKIIFNSDYLKGPSEIELKNLTILVGPNNSGKSQSLKDIENWYVPSHPGPMPTIPKMKLIKSIETDLPKNYDELLDFVTLFKTDPPRNPPSNSQSDDINYSIIDPRGGSGNSLVLRIKELRNQPFTYTPESALRFLQNHNITKGCCVRLDSETRFALTKDKPRGDILQAPQNLLAYLFQRDDVAIKLRQIINVEFDRFFYLDPTRGGDSLKIVMSLTSNPNPKSLEKQYAEFFRNADLLEGLGDGIKTFTGLLLAAVNPQYKIILIDDPEAFLHPPKAYSLGRYLSSLVIERDGTLIVGTHSSDFLMGCLDTTSMLTIIRLTYDGSKGTIRRLEAKDVLTLAHDPLLRSTNVMDALFHGSAIVVEGDVDRVFYSEINRKLLLDRQGIPDVLFIKAIGKDTIHRIVVQLRKIGIPTAFIYDLDIIRKRNHDKLWQNVLNAANIPLESQTYFEGERKFFDEKIPRGDSDSDVIKLRGFCDLSDTDKIRADVFLKRLQEFGVFVVPIGEVERWLSYLYKGDDRGWLQNILETLESPLVKPSDDDVWKFLTEIRLWITNNNRLGM